MGFRLPFYKTPTLLLSLGLSVRVLWYLVLSRPDVIHASSPGALSLRRRTVAYIPDRLSARQSCSRLDNLVNRSQLPLGPCFLLLPPRTPTCIDRAPGVAADRAKTPRRTCCCSVSVCDPHSLFDGPTSAEVVPAASAHHQATASCRPHGVRFHPVREAAGHPAGGVVPHAHPGVHPPVRSLTVPTQPE